MTILMLVFDLILIGLLVAGIHYAIKLTRQLAEMRAGRAEMERFVYSFNATVERAEAGIRGLKSAARSSGDDLEGLIEKGQMLRDELHFLTESADQIATRLSITAGQAAQKSAPAQEEETLKASPAPRQPIEERKAVGAESVRLSAASSTAEKELLRVLGQKG